VRPTNLQPGQNPNYKSKFCSFISNFALLLTDSPSVVLKWVVDTSADKSSGTVEEMEAAVEQVTAGNNVEESGLRTTGEAGNAALPGLNGSTPAPPPPASAPTTQVATATLESSSNPIKEVMQPGSAQEGGVTTVTGGQGQGIVHEAVKPLEGVPSQGLVDGGGQTEQKDKSLMEE